MRKIQSPPLPPHHRIPTINFWKNEIGVHSTYKNHPKPTPQNGRGSESYVRLLGFSSMGYPEKITNMTETKISTFSQRKTQGNPNRC